jgi:hypothetical protein
MINKEILIAHMNSVNCNYRLAGESLGIRKQAVLYYMNKYKLKVVKKISEK